MPQRKNKNCAALFGRKDQTNTIVTGTNNRLAVMAQSSTENRTAMALVFSQQRPRPCIPSLQCLIHRGRYKKVLLRRRKTQQTRHGILKQREHITMSFHISHSPKEDWNVPHVPTSHVSCWYSNPRYTPFHLYHQ